MTTIAYKDGVIACDSRHTCGSLITSDARSKHVKRGNHHFFMCGNYADQQPFLDAYIAGHTEVSKHLDIEALVWDGSSLYLAGADEGELWKQPIPAGETRAVGSGAPHALTAMDMGADAKTAVKMAAKRDSGTGGRIRTFKINAAR